MEYITEILNKYTPHIIGGFIGSVINRIRTKMTWIQFLGSIVIAIFLAIFVGIVLKDYVGVEKDSLIFSACGIVGTFSKILLDEIEEIIGMISEFVRKKFIKDENDNLS